MWETLGKPGQEIRKCNLIKMCISRFRRLCGRSCECVAARLLGFWVQSPRRENSFLVFVCEVWRFRLLWRADHSMRGVLLGIYIYIYIFIYIYMYIYICMCVCVCDWESSTVRKPMPYFGSWTKENKNNVRIIKNTEVHKYIQQNVCWLSHSVKVDG